jgi:ArsR family transcriptional regulator
MTGEVINELSDREINLLAAKFKILSEPSRLKILRCLFEGELCVCDICESTGLLQSNASKQLGHLYGFGIVDYRDDGLKRYYDIIDPTIKQICHLLCGDNH